MAILSSFCGVTYTCLFSVSLFSTVWLNYQNHSTIGYSTDYSLIAWAGFFFLLMNQLTGFVYPYSEAGRVNPMDLVFAIIAFLLSSAQLTQTQIYTSEVCSRSVIVATSAVFTLFFILFYVDVGTSRHYEEKYGYSLLIYMALAKDLSTLVKYLYQIHKNYER